MQLLFGFNDCLWTCIGRWEPRDSGKGSASSISHRKQERRPRLSHHVARHRARQEAFRSDDGAAEIVIARWYDNTEPYDLSNVDRSQADPSLVSIDGRVEEAYLTAGEYGPRVSRFSAKGLGDWMILNIEYSYSASGGPNEDTHRDFGVLSRTGSLILPRERCVDRGARVFAGRNDAWFSVGREPTEKWAPGHYAVFVYAGGRKVAEVYYEVTP